MGTQYISNSGPLLYNRELCRIRRAVGWDSPWWYTLKKEFLAVNLEKGNNEIYSELSITLSNGDCRLDFSLCIQLIYLVILLKYSCCAVFYKLGLLVAQMIKNLPAMQENWVRFLDWEWQSTLSPGEFYGQRRLVDYIPWGCNKCTV